MLEIADARERSDQPGLRRRQPECLPGALPPGFARLEGNDRIIGLPAIQRGADRRIERPVVRDRARSGGERDRPPGRIVGDHRNLRLIRLDVANHRAQRVGPLQPGEETPVGNLDRPRFVASRRSEGTADKIGSAAARSRGGNIDGVGKGFGQVGNRGAEPVGVFGEQVERRSDQFGCAETIEECARAAAHGRWLRGKRLFLNTSQMGGRSGPGLA